MSVKRVVKVKIREIINPRTFWATESKKLTQQNLKVKGMESLLEDQMRSRGERITEGSLIPGTYVAVKYEGKWRRGRLESVYKEKFLLTSVFLLDYGITVHRIKSETCIRKLDFTFLRLQSLAFQVVLSGLAPLTMELDWTLLRDDKMKLTRASKWDESATTFVSAILSHLPLEAELSDFVVDESGRRHGTVRITTDLGKISLNDLLVEKKYAEYSRGQFEHDLTCCDHDNTNTFPFHLPAISEENSKESLDPPEPLLSATEEAAPSETGDTLEHFVDNDPKARVKPGGLSFIEPKPEIRPRNGFLGRGGRLSGPVSRSRLNKSGAAQFSTLVPINRPQQPALTSSEKLLQSLRRGSISTKTSNDEDETLVDWDAVNTKEKSRKDEDGKKYFVPGGVVKGKFHESVLSHILAGNNVKNNDDLRKKFEEFVIIKNK